MAIRSERAATAPEQNPILSGPSSSGLNQTDPLNLGIGRETPPQSGGGVSAGATRRRRLAAALLTGAVALTLTGASGCSLLNNAKKQLTRSECLDEFMIDHRNKVFAARAWFEIQDCYKDQPFLSEFKAGFIAGYAEIAEGGDGCAPCTAPSQYWGWQYQSAGGQSAIDAWFAGFPLGVKAAEQDGVGHWGRVRPMSRPTAQQVQDAKEASKKESEMRMGPDGKPAMQEIIVPGSERVITDPAEIERLKLQLEPSPEMLDPPLPSNGLPEIEADGLMEPGDLIPGDVIPGSVLPGFDDTSSASENALKPGQVMLTGNQSGIASETLPPAKLVPRKPAATFSLQDAGDAGGVDGIFGPIELPKEADRQTDDADSKTSKSTATTIPFKFE